MAESPAVQISRTFLTFRSSDECSRSKRRSRSAPTSFSSTLRSLLFNAEAAITKPYLRATRGVERSTAASAIRSDVLAPSKEAVGKAAAAADTRHQHSSGKSKRSVPSKPNGSHFDSSIGRTLVTFDSNRKTQLAYQPTPLAIVRNTLPKGKHYEEQVLQRKNIQKALIGRERSQSNRVINSEKMECIPGTASRFNRSPSNRHAQKNANPANQVDSGESSTIMGSAEYDCNNSSNGRASSRYSAKQEKVERGSQYFHQGSHYSHQAKPLMPAKRLDDIHRKRRNDCAELASFPVAQKVNRGNEFQKKGGRRIKNAQSIPKEHRKARLAKRSDQDDVYRKKQNLKMAFLPSNETPPIPSKRAGSEAVGGSTRRLLTSIPSVGSICHEKGNCRPCNFVHTVGCRNGTRCVYCHFHHGGPNRLIWLN